MLKELGVNPKIAILILMVLYFVVKWAVRNGVREAYEYIQLEKSLENEKSLSSEDKNTNL